MSRRGPKVKEKLHIPVDDISEADLEKDLNYLKAHSDNVAGDEEGVTGEETENDEKKVIYGDESMIKANERVGLRNRIGDGSRELGGRPGQNEDLLNLRPPPIVHKTTRSRGKSENKPPRGDSNVGGSAGDEDFEKLKELSSKLQDSDDVTEKLSAEGGAKNDTDKRKLDQLLAQFKDEGKSRQAGTLADGDDENDDEENSDGGIAKSSSAEDTLRTASTGNPRALAGNATAARKLHAKFKMATTRKYFGKHVGRGRRPKIDKGGVNNHSRYGIDDDAIARAIAQPEPLAWNQSEYSIVDEGKDRVDIPVTGRGWQTIIHGRRDVIVAGAVIASVGFLIIVASIIYMLIGRGRNKQKNANENKQYRRLGTTDERVGLNKARHAAIFHMSSDEETDEEDDEEDTLYIRGHRGKK